MTRRRLPPAWKPVGRWVDGTLRPLEPIPWVAMGPRIGQVDASELERGLVSTDQVTGTSCVTPDTAVLDRLLYYPHLYKSGQKGTPLPGERPFYVVPSSQTPPDLAPSAPPLPATNLTQVWPQLFAPGKGGGERPQTVVNTPVSVGAGATANIITLPELPRGMAAVIKMFGQTAADFTNLLWTFLAKGRPLDPIVSINFQFGQLFLPVALPGTGVELGPGDDFVVQVVNTGGAAVAGVRARVDLYQFQLFGGGAS